MIADLTGTGLSVSEDRDGFGSQAPKQKVLIGVQVDGFHDLLNSREHACFGYFDNPEMLFACQANLPETSSMELCRFPASGASTEKRQPLAKPFFFSGLYFFFSGFWSNAP